MVDKNVSETPVDDVDPDEVIPLTYAITSYGADYPVDGLVKRIQEDAILIPDFQRRFVWKRPQASRFIESLLLGLPVPGVFLEKEADAQKLLIIDGQQRLLSLFYFYDGIFRPTKEEFTLKGVQEQFEGQSYSSLADEDRRRLDDSIIHATVVRQDEPSGDRGSIYHVFERLNTGGTPLSPQEIRTCVYHGDFCDLLKSLNENVAWRKVVGKPNSRMKDQELILRFLALYHNASSYGRPMKGFLNDFMGTHRNLDLMLSASDFRREFCNMIEVVLKSIGPRAFRPQSTINAAVFDAVSVGIAKRLERGSIERMELIEKAYGHLLASDEFQTAFKKATADEASVRRRLELAEKAFANIE